MRRERTGGKAGKERRKEERKKREKNAELGEKGTNLGAL